MTQNISSPLVLLQWLLHVLHHWFWNKSIHITKRNGQPMHEILLYITPYTNSTYHVQRQAWLGPKYQHAQLSTSCSLSSWHHPTQGQAWLSQEFLLAQPDTQGLCRARGTVLCHLAIHTMYVKERNWWQIYTYKCTNNQITIRILMAKLKLHVASSLISLTGPRACGG